MLKAIKENNIDEIKKLLKNPEDFRNGNDKMALINAVHHGNLEIVNLLLESNIDIHDNNDIALVIAVCSGHLEVFDAMIRRGFIHGDDYFYTDDERHLSVIYRYIDNDFDIDGSYVNSWPKIRWPKINIYPKKTSEQTNHIEIIKKLIQHGSNVNTMIDMPLRAAAYVGNVEVINLLMASGAKVENLMKYRQCD